MRRRYENNTKLYEYQIVSNCIGGGVFVNDERVGTVPASGKFIYESPKNRLSTIHIQGGLPPENREEIDRVTDTTTELIEAKDVHLAIALQQSPSRAFIIRLIEPNQFTLRTTIRTNVVYLVTRYYNPNAMYGVNYGDPIVLNYRKEQYEMPDLETDSYDNMVTPDSGFSWGVRLTGTDLEQPPTPESYTGHGFNDTFLPRFDHATPGEHYASYTAYVNLDLVENNGDIVHTEYLILDKRIDFTI